MARPPLRLQCGACSASSSAICKENHTLYKMYPRVKQENRLERLCEASSHPENGKEEEEEEEEEEDDDDKEDEEQQGRG